LAGYLAERFADVLTSKDALELFKKLEQSLRSRSKAAAQCGLERKTVYNWEKNEILKLSTKKKVLSCLLEVDARQTLAYMVKRSAETAAELLNIYLTTLFEHAMKPDIDRRRLELLLEEFEVARAKHESVILDRLETQVSEMLPFLQEKTSELGISYNPRQPEIIRMDSFASALPTIVRELQVADNAGILGLSKKFGIQLPFLESLAKSLREIRYVRLSMTSLNDTSAGRVRAQGPPLPTAAGPARTTLPPTPAGPLQLLPNTQASEPELSVRQPTDATT